MKKMYCVVCGKYRKFKNPKVYIFEKEILSIICSKCGSKEEKIFKEEQLIEIVNFLDLINNIEKYQKYD